MYVITSHPVPGNCRIAHPTTGEFLVTSYGNGLGVGMSKTGADYMANNKSSYKKILSTYFNGTKLTQEEKV